MGGTENRDSNLLKIFCSLPIRMLGSGFCYGLYSGPSTSLYYFPHRKFVPYAVSADGASLYLCALGTRRCSPPDTTRRLLPVCLSGSGPFLKKKASTNSFFSFSQTLRTLSKPDFSFFLLLGVKKSPGRGVRGLHAERLLPPRWRQGRRRLQRLRQQRLYHRQPPVAHGASL